MVSVLTDKVTHREVCELQTNLTDNTCLSPSERELNLVACLWSKTKIKVNRSVCLVWYRLEVDILRVEVAHLSKFLI